MPHKFKAPVEFFQANQLPPRCLITGRTDDIQYHDLQLPFLRGFLALPAILIQPLPAPKNPTVPPAALHDRESPAWRDLRGLIVWALLFSWFGYLFGGLVTILSLNLGLLLCSLVYRIFFKAWRQRTIAAKALHFSLPLAIPNAADLRKRTLNRVLYGSVSLPYYVATFLFISRIHSPLQNWYTSMFWITWVVFIFTNRRLNNAYPMLTLNPKKTVLEIRLPDINKPLFDEYCVQFMRWKQTEHFPTDIDYDINDWPDEGDGTWDASPGNR